MSEKSSSTRCNYDHDFSYFYWGKREEPRVIAFVVTTYYAGKGERTKWQREKSGQKKREKIKMRARTEKGRSAVSTCRLVGRSVYNKTDTRRRI